MNFKVMTKEKIDEEVAKVFIDLINQKKNPVLGLATGSTPLGVYNNLIKAYEKGNVSFKNVKSFNLDEYVGLSEDNDQSYRYFMNHNLFDHIDIDKKNTNVPQYDKYQKDNLYYDKMIDEAGGIDIQILGIGSDGHIAFNEPNSSFENLTHIESLAKSTIEDNARFFNDISEVPTKALTMGLKSIMKAKKIVLLAYGKNKQQAIKELKKGYVSEHLPASILHKHPDVVIYCDKEAFNME